MSLFLKLFENHTQYEEARQNLILPNVSYCVNENEVHYNTYVPQPDNIIIYSASAKLAETTSNKTSGLHTNAFNTTIASHTFENGVGTIEFDEDVTSIGEYAFYYCYGLTSIDIPSGVTSIGRSAFYQCSGLTSIDMPSGVTSIGDYTFLACYGLTSIDIPDSVTSIGPGAFQQCTGLTSCTIGSGVTSISSNAFNDCRNLTSAIVNATTPPTLGYYAFDSTNNCPIYVPSGSVETYKSATNWSTYASRIQAIPQQ